jgi:hypothetical protein
MGIGMRHHTTGIADLCDLILWIINLRLLAVISVYLRLVFGLLLPNDLIENHFSMPTPVEFCCDILSLGCELMSLFIRIFPRFILLQIFSSNHLISHNFQLTFG